MSYRVCIPCAGTGSRLGELTRFLNKALVSISHRPVISRIIEQFPPDVEFVIALGYKGNLVREYLTLAYPCRNFIFEEVLPFEGPGAGLGLSLLKCKVHLQQPFVFNPCDTLVDAAIPTLDHNWMGYAEASDQLMYRTVEVTSGRVNDIAEKGVGCYPEYKPYIGLVGIKDYREFWYAMSNGGQICIDEGEVYGLRALLPLGIKAYEFSWSDTGNPTTLDLTQQKYRQGRDPNILQKESEAIWFNQNIVIKFSDDPVFIANRVERSKLLDGFVPQVTGATEHMYSYEKAAGSILSEVVTLPLFNKFLAHCSVFWERIELTENQRKDFQTNCLNFYKQKTYERVNLFYKKFSRRDGDESINGLKTQSLAKMLDSIDWHWLAEGLAGRFHGDFHFENILWNSDDQKFVFLDWRQDFGGDLAVGDQYYDFAKLYHGLIVSHEMIINNHYWINWDDHCIDFDFHRKQILVDCERSLFTWLPKQGLETKKVKVITALIFLNIAALHHAPYSLLLFALGKTLLKTELDG